jgi:hypothetical protein
MEFSIRKTGIMIAFQKCKKNELLVKENRGFKEVKEKF